MYYNWHSISPPEEDARRGVFRQGLQRHQRGAPPSPADFIIINIIIIIVIMYEFSF